MGVRTNLIEEQYVQFSFLSEGQKRIIFSELLEVLQYIGADINHEGARDLLRENGCTVKGKRVYIPSQLVRRCIRSTPYVTTIHHWDNSGRLRIEFGRTYFGPGPTCPYFLDPYTGKRRRYLKQDAALVARTCDFLSNIGFVMSMGSISDVTDGLEEIYEFAEMVQNCSKPVIAWCFTREHCRDIHKMAAAMSGGEEQLRHRPIYLFYNEPISPLTCDHYAIDKLMYCAKYGIPQIFAPANTGGATVPATHSGHLVVTIAESLIGVVISQLVQPGACIIIGGTQSILDMSAAIFSYGAPELSILSAGLSEMAEYIGLPVFIAAGCSDSKDTDLQSSIEYSLSLHSAMLSGANLVHDVGFLESGMVGSLPQLVLADEVISMCRFITQGVNVSEETLALQEIQSIGPQGSYQDTDYTKKWSQNHWKPSLLDRNNFEQWQSSGAKTLKDRVFEKTQSIIDKHPGPSQKVSQKTKDQISKILDQAEERIASAKSNKTSKNQAAL